MPSRLLVGPPLPEPGILALLFSDVTRPDVEFRRAARTSPAALIRERATRASPASPTRWPGGAQALGVDTFQLTLLVDPNAQSSRLDPGRGDDRRALHAAT